MLREAPESVFVDPIVDIWMNLIELGFPLANRLAGRSDHEAMRGLDRRDRQGLKIPGKARREDRKSVV